MTQTTTAPTQTATPSKDRTMNHHRPPLARAITYLAYFLGLLLLTTLWTVYGPSYDAQAAPSDATSTTSDPCPAGEATGGTCGTEGPVDDPAASDSTSPAPDTTPTPQRRCKGCRLTQEEYDARQADKQAAHDRAEARKQRGAERRAEADRRREEKAARKASKSSPAKSSRPHASKASESSSDGSSAPSPTDTTSTGSEDAQNAAEASNDGAPSDDTSDSESSPTATAPYTPLEIPEASRRPAPYDASKDPFEVRREAARQAADAVNHASDQVKAPTTTAPTTSASSGYWAEQLPTWALALIGFLAAAGIFTYRVSRPRSSSQGDRRS